MTNTHEAEGRIEEAGQFSFGERLLSGQTLVTNGFAVKYERIVKGREKPQYNFRLYIVHPSSMEVYFDRQGMVFPAPVALEDLDGFLVSKVKTISQVEKVYIGDADLTFEKLFSSRIKDEQDLELTLTSPGFIDHVVEKIDIPIIDIRKAYIQRAQSEV